jgi:hypothetical protein
MALAMTPRPDVDGTHPPRPARRLVAIDGGGAPSPRPTPRPVVVPALRPVTSHANASRASAAVYRRRRLVALALVSLVLALAVVVVVMGRAAADADGGAAAPAAPAVYVVQPGDTLWRIVERLAPERDPRPLVASLEKAAGGSALQPGQRIVLPPSLQR